MKLKLPIIVLSIVILLFSCTYVENFNNKNRLQGTWVTTKKANFISAITFNNENCTFDYLGFKVGGSYKIDEDIVYVNTNSEMGMITFRIIDENTLLGGLLIESTYKSVNSFKATGKPSKGSYSTVNALNMRAGTSTEYQVITTIPAKTKIKAVEVESDGWIKVEYDKMEGYVSAKYLKKL